MCSGESDGANTQAHGYLNYSENQLLVIYILVIHILVIYILVIYILVIYILVIYIQDKA